MQVPILDLPTVVLKLILPPHETCDLTIDASGALCCQYKGVRVAIPKGLVHQLQTRLYLMKRLTHRLASASKPTKDKL